MRLLFSLLISCLIYGLPTVISADGDDGACKIVNSEGKGILAIGETQQSIMIVTTDYYFLNVNKSALNTKTHTFTLRAANYTLLEKQFPKFAENEHFQKIKKDIYSGFIHSYNGVEELDLHLIFNKHKDVGVRFLVSHNKFIPGRTYINVEKYYYLLPKFDSADYYGFTQQGDVLEVSYWHESQDRITYQNGGLLCKNGQEIYVSDKLQPCKENLNWGAKRGFISGGFAYMFDSKNVSIFQEDLLKGLMKREYQDKKYSIQEKNYADYFDCSGSAALAQNVVYDAPKKASLGLIILLVVLLVILICCLCMGTLIVMERRRKKNNGSSSSMNQSKRAQRSSLIPTFGLLSRMNTNQPNDQPKVSRSKINSNRKLARLSRKSGIEFNSNVKSQRTLRSGLTSRTSMKNKNKKSAIK